MPVQAPDGIKSIQRGTIVIGASSISSSATITAVDTARAVVKYLGWSCMDSAASDAYARLWLTNATTVGAVRSAAGANPCTVSYEVVEYY